MAQNRHIILIIVILVQLLCCRFCQALDDRRSVRPSPRGSFFSDTMSVATYDKPQPILADLSLSNCWQRLKRRTVLSRTSFYPCRSMPDTQYCVRSGTSQNAPGERLHLTVGPIREPARAPARSRQAMKDQRIIQSGVSQVQAMI